MIVEKNIQPTTLVQLRAGTGTTTYYNPAAFTAQGITFSDGINISITHDTVATDNLWNNIDLNRDITGVLSGSNATLNNPSIYCSTDVNVSNTAVETANVGGTAGFAYYQCRYTFDSVGAAEGQYWPSVFDLILESTSAGLATINSWVWGIGLSYELNGIASTTTIHSDSWLFKAEFDCNVTTVPGITSSDWTNYYSTIDGLNDATVSLYGFRSIIENIADAYVYTGYFASYDSTTASTAHSELFIGVITGTRDTATSDNGIVLSFGDPITPITYTLNNAAANAYGIRIVTSDAGFTHTLGNWYGIGITVNHTVAAGTSNALNIITNNQTNGATFSNATDDLIINRTNGQQLYATVVGASEFMWVIASAQTTNQLIQIDTSTAVTTSALMQAIDVEMSTTAASAVNMVEVIKATLKTEVQVGNYVNALSGKINFGGTGYATGLAGVVCAELNTPTLATASGTYTCFEAEINAINATNTVPVSFMTMNAWGAGVAGFNTYGNIFDINGLTEGAGNILDAIADHAATHTLRIRLDGVLYYLLATNTLV
jgi:hypothetical protein